VLKPQHKENRERGRKVCPLTSAFQGRAVLPRSWQRRTGIQCLVEAHKSQHLPPPQSKLEFDFKLQNDSPPLEEDARDV
jgi:hypothetical protein